MAMKFLSKMFGSRNDRIIKRLNKTVGKINALEDELAVLTDEQLKAKTDEFRTRLNDGATLDDLMFEAFAVVREAGKRVFNMRHFDSQMIGAMVLNDHKIAEMRTGEGKTLVATLAVYLNAISGRGVHLVTVNDYLAQRDSEWMGQLYSFLGLSTGVIVSGLTPDERRVAYACDVTYGTNNEFGFDYLRDNMAFSIEEKVQRGLHFAIIDEVDSILIDEARTPLIISGPTEDRTDLYTVVNEMAPTLTRQSADDEDGPGDYSVDEKSRQVYLTEEGHEKVETMLVEAGLLGEGESLYDPSNIMLIHHIYAALRAHVLFERNVHYIVRDGQIVIVDEFTGRTMPGRRWSEGLHQAVEAKEGVIIQSENQTLASITFQNYFRMYDKLAGMTGTADTEAFEFQQIYSLEVVVVPTNKPMIRDDQGDLVYMTEDEKYNAIAADIGECMKTKQPVLVGTASIESSELLSGMLDKLGVKHEVLNAKQHEREAAIVAMAGELGAVTIATNMAGRGTDIVLGGNLKVVLDALGENPDQAEVDRLTAEWQEHHDAVLAVGGLRVIGSERNESRRIDNQLRGRSGRQGDPGSTRFYLSLQDSLMRIFASDKVTSLMQRLGMEEGEAIEHPWVTKAIANAQRKVEANNFDMRKHLLEFDDVSNDQRKVIYEQRNELMATEDVSETIAAIRHDVVNGIIDLHMPPGSIDEQWDVPGLEQNLEEEFGISFPVSEWLEADHDLHEESVRGKVIDELVAAAAVKEEVTGSESMRHFEKSVLLQVVDHLWKEHLAAMDYLRQSINLRSYAQKNPKQEYKRESFEMFQQLLEGIKAEVVRVVTRVEIRSQEESEAERQAQQAFQPMSFEHAKAEGMAIAEASSAAFGEGTENEVEVKQTQTYVRDVPKVGRNEPCPCGSGKKYKQCHGKLT